MSIKTFFDFCSGIGAGRLGLEMCGLRSVGYSDTSRLAVTTYNILHDTSNERNWGDLRKINCEELPIFDVLIAGFPCQAFSVIGRKGGFSDIRGQIIFHIATILEKCKPKCFILENVRGLVSHNKGESLSIIIDTLNKSGYNVIFKVLTSLDYGVPQMRQRVYFIGVRKNLGIDIEKFTWPEQISPPALSNYLIDVNNEIDAIERGLLLQYLNNKVNNGLYVPEDFLCEDYLVIDTRMSDLRLYRNKVPTLRSQRDGIYYVRNASIHNLTGYEALLLQGFPKEYANKVKNNVTNRHLLYQAGNAMTVNVITKLGQSLQKLFE